MEKGVKNALSLGIVFFITFTSFGGGSSLMSSIYDQESFKGLGQLNTFVLYLTFSFGTLFSEKIVSW
jgi:hypothetical protein